MMSQILTMGTELKLPAQYEQHRDELTNALIPIEVRNLDKKVRGE